MNTYFENDNEDNNNKRVLYEENEGNIEFNNIYTFNSFTSAERTGYKVVIDGTAGINVFNLTGDATE